MAAPRGLAASTASCDSLPQWGGHVGPARILRADDRLAVRLRPLGLDILRGTQGQRSQDSDGMEQACSPPGLASPCSEHTLSLAQSKSSPARGATGSKFSTKRPGNPVPAFECLIAYLPEHCQALICSLFVSWIGIQLTKLM